MHGGNGKGFEQSFGRLQEVVRKLTEGNLTLEEALSLFEEGMALADGCMKMLDEAELRVQAVSARTLKGVSGALQELEAAMLNTQLEGDDGGIVSMSVESFESSLRSGAVDDSGNLAYNPLPGEKRGGAQRADSSKAPGTGANTNTSSKARPEELDPLFDEDD